MTEGHQAAPAELTLDDYLQLEDDIGFVEAVCPNTGILAWPAIRQEVLRTLLGDRLYPTASPAGVGPRQSLARAVPAAMGAIAWNAAHPARRSDVLILATGAGLVPVDGRLRNRYVDGFAGVLGARAWTVEASFPGLRSMRTRRNRRVGSLFVDRARIAVVSRVVPRRAQRSVMVELVDLAITRGRDLLGWELGDRRRRALIELGSSRLAGYPMKSRLYARMFREVEPRLAIVEEGCYGHMAVFNALARDHGIVVAEFQHGLVTRGHDAYNVAPALASSDAYRRTQPHAFLGYGDWWLDQMSTPVVDRIAIGNPHRSSTLRTWSAEPERVTVLVLGDGVETDAHIAFAQEIARHIRPPFRVAFRPHPLEAGRVAATHPGVEVDRGGDLYRSLARAHAVVAESSTALFEAAGLVPRVFVWDTAKSRFYLGDHPFERARDAADLAKRLAKANPTGAELSSSVWATDWESRFLEYVGEAY